MKNAENRASYPYDERKTRKITLYRGTMNKKTVKINFPSRGKTRKQLKTAFPHEGKQEFSENQLSLTRVKKQTAKNEFPPRGKTKNQRKILSQNWENEKMWKIGFPKLGKNKKSQRLHFPTLGRIKNTIGSFSNPLDERFFLFSFIQLLGRAIFLVFRSSNPLYEQFFLFFVHPRPRTGCFSDFLLIRGLGRAFQCVAFHQSVCCLV